MRLHDKFRSSDESPSRMLLDNKNHGKVIDELKLHLNRDAKLSILTGAFSVFGFSALKSENAGGILHHVSGEIVLSQMG